MDRQDIDALLIGALYGELTPAEEARLTAHLDSHPTDRGALDDLKSTRQAVLDSRIFQVQLDPPQSVSALLLQEAHRRAPKVVAPRDEKEGWFARFTRSFMAHPAMAAAAMLVLVMGGAGILWMKKGDQFADRQYSQAPASSETSLDPQTTPVAAQPSGVAEGAAGSAMQAGLADEQDQAKLDELAAADGKAESASDRWNANAAAADEGRARAEAQKQKRAGSVAIEVKTDQAPKDFEQEKALAKADDDNRRDTKGGAAKGPMPSTRATSTDTTAATAAPGRGGGGGGDLAFGGEANAVTGAGAAASGNARGGYAPPPPPAAPKNAKVATTTATKKSPPPEPKAPVADKSTATGGKVAAENKPAPQKVAKPSAPATATPTAPPKQEPAKEATKDSSLVAWAKGEHSRAVALARNGDCAGAARVAVTVSNKASAYYSQYMATDRALKGCQTHIAAERDKDAERSQKARASKRVNANEPAAPSESLK